MSLRPRTAPRSGDTLVGVAPVGVAPVGVALVVVALFGVLLFAPTVGAQIDFDLACNEVDLRLDSEERFDYHGTSIAIGDLDGDGHADLVVSAFLGDGVDADRVDAGIVTVHYGRAATPEQAIRAPTRVYGPVAGARLGLGVALGDLDGDGIDDLALSAPGLAGPLGDRPEAGAAVVLLGRRGGWPEVIDLAVTPADLVVHAPDAGDARGGSFVFVPVLVADLVGSDHDDLILGLPGGDGGDGTRPGAGEVHIIAGSSDLAGSIDLREPGTSHVLLGEDAGDLLGVAVTAGDFDGDGARDLVVGAKNADGPSNSSSRVGEAVGLLGGRPWEMVIDLGAPDVSPDFILYGVDRNDRCARALAAGDVDGDGIDDIAVGARHADGAGNDEDQESAGDAYVFLGRPGLTGSHALDTSAAITLHGSDRNDSIGVSLAIGDINGDGHGDLVSGAEFADGQGNRRPRAGGTVVVLGAPVPDRVIDLRSEEPAIHVTGARENDSLGAGVATGDLDGDGCDDLLMGAIGRVYKQLDAPPPDADFTHTDRGGSVEVIRGREMLVRLRAGEPVPAGDAVQLETRIACLQADDQAVRVTLRWLSDVSTPRVLKSKVVTLDAMRSRRIPRHVPVALDTRPGTYRIEATLTHAGTGALIDRDRIAIEVLEP